MAVGYKSSDPKRKKGYSFSDGKFKLGNEEQEVYGPQNNPNASPVDKAGLIPDVKKKNAEQGWKLENEDGTTTDVGTPGGQQNPDPLNPEALDYDADPVAVQEFLKEKGYLKGAVDGKFGKGSKAALSEYYRSEGITPPNAKKLDSTLEKLGIATNSYAGLSEKELKNHPRGNKYLTYKGKPMALQTSEVSSGGEIDPGLITFTENILGPMNKELSGLRLTAGNDAYHHSDEYYARRTKNHKTRRDVPKFKNMSKAEAAEWGRKNLSKSAHTAGTKIDFVVDDPKKAREFFLANGFVKKGKYFINEKEGYKILDEYAVKTSGGTGGHFDIEVINKK